MGFVGRFARDKNPLALAQAVSALPPQFRAVYVGKGIHEAEVRQQATALLGERITFVPQVEHVGDALAALDVFFLASPSEGHCQSLNEAWAAGLPTVATRVGAVPEIEERWGRCVFPVEHDDSPEHLAAAVRAALRPDGQAVVENARRVAWREFNLPKTKAARAAWYRQIARRR